MGVGDIAQYGDYVLLAYTTKHLVQDGNYTSKAASTRAKASYGTDLDNNFYLGVYKFDPTDADKEYLKYQSMIVRKSEDHPGKKPDRSKATLGRARNGYRSLGDKILPVLPRRQELPNEQPKSAFCCAAHQR